MSAERDSFDFLPEPPGLLLEARALVAQPLARALLRELARRQSPVAIRRSRDPGIHRFGRIVDCSDEAIALDLAPGRATEDAPEQSRASALHAILPPPAAEDDYVAVSYLDGVKIQFDARLGGGQAAAGCGHLRGAAPLAVYRLQRRDAYRVPTAPGQGRCVIRQAPGKERSLGIVDLSVRGLLLAWQDDERPDIGVVWEHSRIEFADRPPLPCMLVATRIDEADDSPRVGCEFGPMPPEVERALQVLVNDLQLAPRRAR